MIANESRFAFLLVAILIAATIGCGTSTTDDDSSASDGNTTTSEGPGNSNGEPSPPKSMGTNGKVIGTMQLDQIAVMLGPLHLSDDDPKKDVNLDKIRFILKTNNSHNATFRNATAYLYAISDGKKHAILSADVGTKKPGELIHVLWEMPFEHPISQEWHDQRRNSFISSGGRGPGIEGAYGAPAILIFIADNNGVVAVDCTNTEILDPGLNPLQGYRKTIRKQREPAIAEFPEFFKQNGVPYPQQ